MDEPLHILLVDDDEDVREILAAMLATANCRVTCSRNGKTMREVLGREAIDLVLLDAWMPGEPLASLVDHLNTLQIPLLIMSGSPHMIEFAAGQNLRCLEKPFRFDTLFAAISKALDAR